MRSFDEYRKKLTENFVLLSRIERRDRILRDLEAQGRRLGGRAMLHQHPLAQALLEEVPDLVEFPAVVAGAFSAEFLALPEEVLTTTLIHHQHFFPVVGSDRRADAGVSGGDQHADGQRPRHRHQRRARRRGAAARRAVLLGRRPGRSASRPAWSGSTPCCSTSSSGRTGRRPSASRRWRAGSRRTSSDGRTRPTQPARAARLAKADLATDMVREFTELQGTMGGIYAREAGEPEAVWKAIYHHYLPTGVEATAPPLPEALGDGA